MTQQDIHKLNEWHDFNNQEGILAIVVKVNEIVDSIHSLSERIEALEGKKETGGVGKMIVDEISEAEKMVNRGFNAIQDNIRLQSNMPIIGAGGGKMVEEENILETLGGDMSLGKKSPSYKLSNTLVKKDPTPPEDCGREIYR